MDNNNNPIGFYRLKLTGHFEIVRSEIDLFIEMELLANFGDEVKSAEINEKREILLEEANEIEQLNMKHLNEDLVDHLESLDGDV
jgi:hypothetical protein